MSQALLLAVVLSVNSGVEPDQLTVKAVWPAKPTGNADYRRQYGRVIEASGGGPFFAVIPTGMSPGEWSVFDARTGKCVGNGDCREQFGGDGHTVLSPDGMILIAILYPTNPQMAGKDPLYVLRAYDTATGKPLWETKGEGRLAAVRFAGADCVVTWGANSPKQYTVIDAKTGRPVGSGPPQGGPQGEPKLLSPLAFSPGGRYAAVSYRREASTLYLVRLTDGGVVQTFQFPEGVGNFTNLAFSPDGKRIAAAFHDSQNNYTVRTVTFDVASGKQDGDVSAYAVPLWTGVRSVVWSSDNKGILLANTVMVHLDTGTVLYRFNHLNHAQANFPLELGRVVRVVLDPETKKLQLQDLTIDAGRIAASIAAAKAGGAGVDGWLPKATAANRPEARPVTVPARADDWTYQPDPAGADLDVANVPLPFPAAWVESFHVTKTSAVFDVLKKDSPKFLAFPKRSLVQLNVDAKKLRRSFDVPHICRLADVSLDDTIAVTVEIETGHRFDVWNLADGKHLLGVRPGNWRKPDDELLFVASVASDRVLTLTKAGELAVWAVPSGKAVYVAAVKDVSTPILSPGRKYLFLHYSETVRVIETATGNLCGELQSGLTGSIQLRDFTPPPLPPAIPALASSPDGLQFVAAFRPKPTAPPQGIVWDLRTAKMTHVVPFPTVGQAPFGGRFPEVVRFAGARHLLVWGSALMGLESKTSERDYLAQLAKRPLFAASAPDSRLWLVTDEAKPSADTQCSLIATTLPDGYASVAVDPLVPESEDRRAVVTAIQVILLLGLLLFLFLRILRMKNACVT